MMPQTEIKDEHDCHELYKSALLNADPFYKHMVLLAWHKFKKSTPEEYSYVASKQRTADPRGLWSWYVGGGYTRF